ncbi:MAG: hypothetical protein Q9187_007884 [Circinaria calcarea]
MPLIRKRRSQAEASPSPPPTRRRRSSTSSSASLSDAEDGTQLDGNTQDPNASSTQDQMVKKLVRLALASEYSRQPLRRADITAKVLAPNSSRNFKAIFALAQDHLRSTFGMTLTELPLKDKITITQKRAAQRATGTSQGLSSASASSKAYVLTSTLPSSLRAPSILAPAKAPSTAAEASYVGLYTFIVSVIYLHQSHRCAEGKLESILKKVNADNYVLGGEKTEKVLKRMERENYIVKIREREAGGEETVDWVVGPRGKVEVGEKGVAGLVKGVFGKKDQEMEELESKLERSLGEGTFRRKSHGRLEGVEEEGAEDDEEEGGGEVVEVDGDAEEEPERMSGRRTSGRGNRRRRDEAEEEEPDEEDD